MTKKDIIWSIIGIGIAGVNMIVTYKIYESYLNHEEFISKIREDVEHHKNLRH